MASNQLRILFIFHSRQVGLTLRGSRELSFFRRAGQRFGRNDFSKNGGLHLIEIACRLDITVRAACSRRAGACEQADIFKTFAN
jgi:hypothetical protein